MFYNGLSVEIKKEINHMPETSTLSGIIDAATKAYNNLAQQRYESKHWNNYRRQTSYQSYNAPRTTGPEPMELDTIKFKKLTQEEKEKRRKEGLCMYCGQKGHYASRCPNKGKPTTQVHQVETQPTPIIESNAKVYYFINDEGQLVPAN